MKKISGQSNIFKTARKYLYKYITILYRHKHVIMYKKQTFYIIEKIPDFLQIA